MRKSFRQLYCLCVAFTGFAISSSYAGPDVKNMTGKSAPLSFIENKGQVRDQDRNARPDIQFSIKAANGLTIFVGDGAIHYQFAKPDKQVTQLTKEEMMKPGFQPEPVSYTMDRMDVELVGANKNAQIIREQKQEYYENYFADWSGDKSAIANTYGRVIYKDIYPNVDWVLYTSNGQLKHEFVVRAGGKVSDIKLRYGGTEALRINNDGSLTAATPQGEITEQAPYTYQNDGKKVTSSFVLSENVLSYNVAQFSGELVIDPGLVWATYHGGSGDDYGQSLAIDAAGNVYYCGYTNSSSYIATTGAYRTIFSGGFYDVFLAKFNNSGAFLWGTYYGGSGDDFGQGVAVDASGSIYITGYTSSSSTIATSGSHQFTYGGGSSDCFLAKFNNSGAIQWATYYGGSATDQAYGVTTDGSGNVYITGNTSSSSAIATSGAYQTAIGGSNDAFLAKFNGSGVIQWATYYGGGLADAAYAISKDASGNIFITGETSSTSGVATSGAYQTTFAGGPISGPFDAFLAQFNSSGSLQWGTYLGGSGDDEAYDITTDGGGNVFISGITSSTSAIATSGAYQTTYGGSFTDGFLAKFNNSGAIQWSTYFGGSSPDLSYGLGTDASGNVFMTGYTSSASAIATTGAYQTTLAGAADAFLAAFNATGTIQWSTYYGGVNNEYSFPLAVDGSGNIFIGGYTASPGGVATSTAYKTAFGGGTWDAYLAKFTSCTPPVVAPVVNSASNICIGATVTLTDATSGGTWSSGNPAIATVGSTGIVTGVAAGNVIISYGVTSGGCTGYSAALVTVGHEIITTVAGTGLSVAGAPGGPATATNITTPIHAAMDAAGNLYFSDYSAQVIRKVNSSGVISNVAGNGTPTYSGDGGPATAAGIAYPAGITFDPAGNMYIADYQAYEIRKVNTAGIISTVAGTGFVGAGADNIAATASGVNHCWGVACDASGNLYFSDRYNYKIRKVDASGIITTVAGNGTVGFSGDGGPATAAKLNEPLDIIFDKSGNMYFTDFQNNRIRKVDPSGNISTFCGNGVTGFAGDGLSVSSTTVQLNNPVGLAIDSVGNIYIGDYGNHRVRMVNTSGIINTVVGNSGSGYNGDNIGATTATLSILQGVSVFGTGDIYICDANNYRVRKVSPISSNVAPIVGSSTLCQGVLTLFTDATPGGTWTSSNPSVASVGSNTGVVTPVAAGTATISYTENYTCNTINVIKNVTVNAFDAGSISGPITVCVGNTISLTDAASGGTWSSSAPGTASVGTGGVVTGVSLGNAIISYTVTNGCGTKAAMQSVMVGAPTITTIAGTGVSGPGVDGIAATAITMNATHSVWVDGAGNIFISDVNNHKIRKINTSGIITTVAGNGSVGAGAEGVPATSTTMQNPFSITVDGAGNLYYSDNLNNKIRKVDPSGIVTTFVGTGTAGFSGDFGPATAANINSPCGIGFDAAGNFYFSDGSNRRIRKVNTSGIITTIAGTGALGSSGDGGPATLATFNVPNYIHVDRAGNVYVVDNGNHKVRLINTFGVIATVAGNGTAGSGGDNGAATAAQLDFPGGVTLDAAGNLFIAGDVTQNVRYVTPSGIIRSYAGTAMSSGYTGDGGPATAAKFNIPVDVTFDISGNLLIADQSNNVVRKVSPFPTNVATVTGTASICQGNSVLFSDATAGGTWTSSNTIIATVGSTTGVVTGVGSGTATISYTVNFACGPVSAIRNVTVNAFDAGIISGPSTVCAGNTITLTDAATGGTWSSSAPGVAMVNSGGIVTGVSSGYTAVSYTITNSCGTKAATQLIIVGVPIITTIAGNGTPAYSGDGLLATAASVQTPAGTLADASGNVYISDFGNNVIRKISPSGIITTIAGTGVPGYLGDGGPATAARLHSPSGITFDPSGNILFAEYNNHVIRKISTTGIISTVAGDGTSGFLGDSGPASVSRLSFPPSVCVDATGVIYIPDANNQRIRKIDLSGTITTIAGTGTPGYNGDGIPATSARLNNPFTVSLDRAGNLLVADQSNHRVRKIDQFGYISTVVGTGAVGSSPDGTLATAALVNLPTDVEFDAAGNMIVVDRNSNCVRMVNAGTGILTTLVNIGNVAGYSGDGGAPATAQLNFVPQVSFDPAGNMYISDYSNNRIRKVQPIATNVAPVTGGSAVCQGSTLPLSDATLGGTWSSSNNTIATVGSTGVVTGIAGGLDTISYSLSFACGIVSSTQTVNVTPLPAVPGPIIGTPIVCVGTTTTLNDAVAGGVWSSTALPIATVGSTGIVTGVSGGTATISYTFSNACGTNAASTVVTVNAATGSVTGASNLCVGATTTLTGAPAGGTWTSSNTTVATIGSSSALVNALTAGTTNITYTYGGGCTTIFPMTVNALPGSILGPGTVCAGSSITLTDGGGGTWTSGSPAVATVGTSSGIVNGLTPGTTLITYTLGTGCSTNTTITVNATPLAINPPTPVTMCVGATAALTDGTPGGTWSSGSPAIATVGTSGAVTGVLAGTATISYSNSFGCSATKNVTVNVTPAALSPLSASVCVNSTTTFTEAVGGGTWSSSVPGTASVVGGVVTGATAGTATISYTIGSCFVVAPVTVNALPAAITPAGPVDVCVGATATLADGSPGGTWSSGAISTATVGTGGVVTGVLAGTAAISYTNVNGCSATKLVTVDVTPTPLSPSGTIVCTGNTVTLTDGVSGGTWTSSAPGTASVAGGVVTGVAVGNATITYTIGTCFSIASITVNLSPNAGSISGPSTMCVGTPITLTDAAPGGVWTSSDNAVATVGATGIVTGVSGGTVTISYSVANSCGTAVATAPVTVNVPAVAGTITGPNKLCAGTVIVLSDASPGGVWSVTNSNASISSTGLLTGITPGIDTILYTVTNACGSAVATYVDTVGIFLTAGTISGPSTVCQGATITLTDPASSGVWSSSSTSATVVGGTVTGVSGGVTTISYTVSAVCGSASATHTVNVIPIPSGGSISGPSTLCVGMTGAYSDPVAGGVWGTSNPVAVISPFGSVTALVVGTDTITYTVTNACGSATASTVLTIGPAISAGSISGPGAVCEAATITLTDAAPGGVWSAANTNAAVAGGIVTGAAAGIDTIAYTVTSSCGSVAATKIVTINPLPDAGAISGPSNVCVGSTITLSDPVTGGSWSASNANATVTAGVVTGVSMGSDVISYTVTNSCGSASVTATVSITNVPSAGTITGPGNVCVGAVITLTDATGGGIWSASNTNASVSGGIVTGLSAGIDIISYTVSSACGTATATTIVTIDPLPSAGAISGPGNVCIGAAIMLTDPVAGGSWTASNSNATVAGGVVTGVAAGTDVISYTVTNGCGSSFATAVVAIDPVPVAGTITGASNVCAGSIITLTDAVPGGIWSASNGRATVAGGIVTGVTAGVDTISYTVTNACGSAATSATVTVNPLPSAGTISGASSVCKSASITLTDAVPGGIWTATNSRATVTSAGIVTGVTVGTDTIIYTVTNICGSATATKPITIAQPATVGPISGAASVCVGNTTTMTDGTLGGSWSSASPAVATVSGMGVVSGITAGTATISYTVANGCGSRAATHSVAVLPITSCESFTNGVNKAKDVFTVYPNPNTGVFSMSLVTTNDEPVTVTITNIIGKTVKQLVTTSNRVTDIQLNTAPGIYLLTATTANERYVVKVTVE